jgi:hypothetical protein
MKYLSLISLMIAALAGCAVRDTLKFTNLDPGHLPKPTIVLQIPGLGPCTDNPDRSLHINSHQPISILVHGCFGSSGQFRGIAQVLAFHGQQTACYTYDDRARLDDSAAQLRQSIQQMATQSDVPLISVIGHSQGALIARKSVASLSSMQFPRNSVDLRLVTISGPFGGIEAAHTCGRAGLYPLTLGLLPLSCYLVTGAKWVDIAGNSPFILDPGNLAPEVVSHLKIDTNERNTCRSEKQGRCVEDDEVFSLEEQRNIRVENDPRVKRLEVNAGHVEIVGNKRDAPMKLLSILQNERIIPATPAAQRSAFVELLAKIYK